MTPDVDVTSDRDAAGDRPIRSDTLASSVVLLLVMTLVQRLIGFGRGVLFCRWLDPEQLGQWDVTFGFLMLAAPLAVLGLPGSFGRYAEFYRCRGQLGTFLGRTTVLCTTMAVLAVLLVASARDWFSSLIFGRADQGALVGWIAVCLGTVIAHNFLVSLFIALRMYRVVNLLQFFQSFGFALLSVPLLIGWRCDVSSVVLAFTVASLISVVGACFWLKEFWPAGQKVDAPVAQRAFWAKLVPFATWVWITNLLSNLFEVIDRYMIVHHSGMPIDEAMRQVGCYHSSRLIPLLFLAIAGLLGAMVTPHLSYDWEAGRRQAVAVRLNTVVKMLAVALVAASTCVLFAAPTLFIAAFGSKLAAGLGVMPFALTYCTWFGMFAVAQNYLWCAEKAGLSSLALFVGLVLSVGLNLLWLPIAGLHGAAAATTVANFAALVLLYLFSQLQGMRIDSGTWLITLAPISICLGPWIALITLVAIIGGTLAGNRLFSAAEKQDMAAAIAGYMAKLKFWSRKAFPWRGPYAKPLEI